MVELLRRALSSSVIVSLWTRPSFRALTTLLSNQSQAYDGFIMTILMMACTGFGHVEALSLVEKAEGRGMYSNSITVQYESCTCTTGLATHWLLLLSIDTASVCN